MSVVDPLFLTPEEIATIAKHEVEAQEVAAKRVAMAAITSSPSSSVSFSAAARSLTFPYVASSATSTQSSSNLSSVAATSSSAPVVAASLQDRINSALEAQKRTLDLELSHVEDKQKKLKDHLDSLSWLIQNPQLHNLGARPVADIPDVQKKYEEITQLLGDLRKQLAELRSSTRKWVIFSLEHCEANYVCPVYSREVEKHLRWGWNMSEYESFSSVDAPPSVASVAPLVEETGGRAYKRLVLWEDCSRDYTLSAYINMGTVDESDAIRTLTSQGLAEYAVMRVPTMTQATAEFNPPVTAMDYILSCAPRARYVVR